MATLYRFEPTVKAPCTCGCGKILTFYLTDRLPTPETAVYYNARHGTMVQQVGIPVEDPWQTGKPMPPFPPSVSKPKQKSCPRSRPARGGTRTAKETQTS